MQAAAYWAAAFGADESPEFDRQSHLWDTSGSKKPATEVLALPQRNHYTILADLCDPASQLTALVARAVAHATIAAGPDAEEISYD